MATTTYPDYATMLEGIRETIARAAGVVGADSIGALLPIAKYETSHPWGEFSNLSEWLDDVADTLQDFITENRDEIETWIAS